MPKDILDPDCGFLSRGYTGTFDSHFQPVAVTEGTHRKGRGHPGHQALQRQSAVQVSAQ
jgi:hypothetical protein